MPCFLPCQWLRQDRSLWRAELRDGWLRGGWRFGGLGRSAARFRRRGCAMGGESIEFVANLGRQMWQLGSGALSQVGQCRACWGLARRAWSGPHVRRLMWTGLVRRGLGKRCRWGTCGLRPSLIGGPGGRHTDRRARLCQQPLKRSRALGRPERGLAGQVWRNTGRPRHASSFQSCKRRQC